MPSKDDDLFGAEALRSEHSADSDGAVADNRYRAAGADPRGDGRMVASAHHVRQGQE